MVLLIATSLTAVEVERSRRALAELTSRVAGADSLPAFVNRLLALKSAERLTDTATARALVQRGVAYARASRQPQRQAQLLEAAGIVQAKLP
jgi:hypothetical protein